MSLENVTSLPAATASTVRSNVLGAVLASATSVALFWIVILDFKFANYLRSVDASLGVVTGHPAWKTFQSRVLGPYIIKALCFGSPDNYVAAHIAFQLVTVAVAAFLCWRLGRKYGGSDQSALFALALFAISFIALLRPPWLYSWDFVDLIVFTVFIDFVLSERPLIWFVGLFAIATWNRDSADFIALWLVIEPPVRTVLRRRAGDVKAPLDWRRMLAGALCIIAGLTLAELLRRALLIQEMAPILFPLDPIAAGHRYNIVLPLNIEFLEQSLFSVTAVIVLTFLATTLWLGAVFARLDPRRHLPLFLVELALMVAMFVFGLINEPRIFNPLIPFFVATAVLVNRARTVPAPA